MTIEIDHWLPVTKGLDRVGGEEPTISTEALAKADFITLPENVDGTNCSSCKFNKNKVCQQPSIKGQHVNERNCCVYWDAPGTFRSWEQQERFEKWFNVKQLLNDGDGKEDRVPASLIEVPDVRQPDHFSCGSACAASVGAYFHVGPKTVNEWKKALDTTEQHSTPPLNIVKYFKQLGCQVEAKDGMSLQDLRKCWFKSWPVIVPVQDYGPERQTSKAKFNYGHYLVVIGICMGYVFCQDPSADNVLSGDQANQAPGRVMIREKDFLRLWYDRDEQNNKYVRFGIAVGAP